MYFRITAIGAPPQLAITPVSTYNMFNMLNRGRVMLGVRLDKDTETRLENLCRETGHTKSYFAKKALKEFIEDREDYLLAVAALEDSNEFVSFEEVRKNLGLVD